MDLTFLFRRNKKKMMLCIEKTDKTHFILLKWLLLTKTFLITMYESECLFSMRLIYWSLIEYFDASARDCLMLFQ